MLKKITAPADGGALPKSKLTAFIEACLDPLPTAVLVDTAYNTQLRRARKAAWREAERMTGAYRDAINLASYFHRPVVGLEPLHKILGGGRRQELVDEWRRLTARQILTPAPDSSALKWKRSAAKRDLLPISAEQIATAIAADEAWLAAHPTKKTGWLP
ncbi:hypothetical protein LB553_07250 [Mesorhizobium sp. CA8]|uniref:hypothetical protein n=1 Tax=Mesorhizobium sp. CA8 TaxID=2876637 RepID=UPI001CD00C62|nr:hypothetical protein [Mesorhizobium sp. CA8]MBZ9760674.1 hypothetical protein [Mesorhizobium sp. CA8]